MAELKAEKERLLSLSREKAHSDKLRERISDLKSLISTKEAEYEDSKQQYDDLVESNRKFYELFNKFREIYITVENLEQNKNKSTALLGQLKSKYSPVPGTWLLPF